MKRTLVIFRTLFSLLLLLAVVSSAHAQMTVEQCENFAYIRPLLGPDMIQKRAEELAEIHAVCSQSSSAELKCGFELFVPNSFGTYTSTLKDAVTICQNFPHAVITCAMQKYRPNIAYGNEAGSIEEGLALCSQ